MGIYLEHCLDSWLCRYNIPRDKVEAILGKNIMLITRVKLPYWCV
jgi:hypothetical protein